MKVLTPTGQWVYMRLIYTTPIYSVMRDANGTRHIATHGVKRGR